MNNLFHFRARALALLAATLLLTASAFSKDKPKDATVVHGAIMDSQCAYNVHSDTHSHDWMTKRGVQGANDEESCTQHCVKDLGGSYVLVQKYLHDMKAWNALSTEAQEGIIGRRKLTDIELEDGVKPTSAHSALMPRIHS